MSEAIYSFLALPIAVRCTIFLFIIFMVYRIFGKLIFKVISLVPWMLNKITYGLYCLFQIPVSVLHRAFGGVFGKIDQWLANGAEWCFLRTETMHSKMKTPKKMFNGTAFLVFIILGVYLLVPMYFAFNERVFTFWQNAYLINEAKIISLILH